MRKPAISALLTLSALAMLSACGGTTEPQSGAAMPDQADNKALLNSIRFDGKSASFVLSDPHDGRAVGKMQFANGSHRSFVGERMVSEDSTGVDERFDSYCIGSYDIPGYDGHYICTALSNFEVETRSFAGDVYNFKVAAGDLYFTSDYSIRPDGISSQIVYYLAKLN